MGFSFYKTLKPKLNFTWKRPWSQNFDVPSLVTQYVVYILCTISTLACIFFFAHQNPISFMHKLDDPICMKSTFVFCIYLSWIHSFNNWWMEKLFSYIKLKVPLIEFTLSDKKLRNECNYVLKNTVFHV